MEAINSALIGIFVVGIIGGIISLIRLGPSVLRWRKQVQLDLDRINDEISAELVRRRIEPYIEFMRQLEPMSTKYKQALEADREKAREFADVFQQAIYGPVCVLASWNTREYIVRARARCLLYAEYRTTYEDLHDCIWAVHQALRSDLGLSQPNWSTEIDARRHKQIAQNSDEIERNIKGAVHMLHGLYEEKSQYARRFSDGKVFSAVIFDMDGLMLDTETIARRAWQNAAQDFGCSISDEEFALLLGLTEQATEATLRSVWQKRNQEAEHYAEIKKQHLIYFEDDILQNGIAKKQGLDSLLDWLDAAHIFKAVASSTRRDLLVQRLTITGLIKRFDVIVSGDEVEKGKPNPDIFELTAKRLEVEAPRCIVLEDSDNGILAAHAAGMIAICVPDRVVRMGEPSGDILKRAYRTFPTLHQVLELLKQSHLNG